MPPTEPTPDLTPEEYVLQLEADRDRLTARVKELEYRLTDPINVEATEGTVP